MLRLRIEKSFCVANVDDFFDDDEHCKLKRDDRSAWLVRSVIDNQSERS